MAPADLNAFLYQYESNIAAFADALGCGALADQFRGLAADRAAAMMATMWDPQRGQWFDLICNPDMPSAPAPQRAVAGGAEVLYAEAAASPAAEGEASGAQQAMCMFTRSLVVSASNWVPLWAGVVETNSTEAMQAVQAFISAGFNQIGGVPATLTASGQQWDYPNVWPPVVDMLIEGFSDVPGGEDLAAQMAERFLTTGLATWEETGTNFEKFNATQVGRPGGGGEYAVVTGFGWTNSVALVLMRLFGYATLYSPPTAEGS